MVLCPSLSQEHRCAGPFLSLSEQQPQAHTPPAELCSLSSLCLRRRHIGLSSVLVSVCFYGLEMDFQMPSPAAEQAHGSITAG